MKPNDCNKINEKTLRQIGFTHIDLNILSQLGILTRAHNFYIYKDVETIYAFAQKLLQEKNYELATKCLKLCYHIKPYFHQASSHLYFRCLETKDFKKATGYLRNLLKCKVEPFISYYKCHLYIISTMIPLEADLKNMASNLTLEDLTVGESKREIPARPIHQEIRKAIYAQKFNYAKTLIYSIKKEGVEIPKAYNALTVLLREATIEQMNKKKQLVELVENDQIEEAISYLENMQSNCRLSLIDHYSLLALKDLQFLTKNSFLASHPKINIENPNLYNMIYCGLYKEAGELIQNLGDRVSPIIKIIIDKILAKLNEKNTDPSDFNIKFQKCHN